MTGLVILAAGLAFGLGFALSFIRMRRRLRAKMQATMEAEVKRQVQEIVLRELQQGRGRERLQQRIIEAAENDKPSATRNGVNK